MRSATVLVFSALISASFAQSNTAYFDPANWTVSVSQTHTSTQITYPSDGHGGYIRTVVPLSTTYSTLTLPPPLTTDSIFTKTKYTYTFTWNGAPGIPTPQKVYVLVSATGSFSPSASGSIDLGVASPPKIASPIDLTTMSLRKINGDSLRELPVTNGVATLEFEGTVSVTHTNYPGKGNAARTDYYGSAGVAIRALSLSVLEPTYEAGNSVEYQPAPALVVNKDINEKRIVTSYDQDGLILASELMTATVMGLWDPASFTWHSSLGQAVWLVSHDFDESRFLDVSISPSEVLNRRTYRFADFVTVDVTATDTLGSMPGKIKYEIHVPLEEYSVQPLGIDDGPWVFQFSRYPGPTARIVTATEVNGVSDVREITHSIVGSIGFDISEFAKASYNYNSSTKIGQTYSVEVSDSQTWTVPATPPANPGQAYMFYKRYRTPKNKHLLRAYDSSGYLGGITQNIDEKSYADFNLEIAGT